MIKGCIFDMDGILLDTETLGMRLLPEIAADHGYALAPSLYLKVLGVNDRLGKQILLEELGPDFPYESVMEAFLDAFLDRARQGTLPPKPGLAECLTGLKARGLRLALATSTRRSVVEVYQASIPILGQGLDAVVCGSEVANSKPAPDIYLHAAKALGLAPGECLGVEDSLNGLKSLTAAGIPSVMIPDLLPYSQSLAPLVTWRLDTLFDLCPLVDQLRQAE